jgi:hypothetical protein
LLECDVEVTSCLELVSKSVGDKQLVFGTVAAGRGKILKVTLTRFRPGPDRQQQTYEITGETEAYPDELVRKAAPLFGGVQPTVIENTPDDVVNPVTTEVPDPVDAAPHGAITPGTWGLIGGGAVGLVIGIGFKVSASGIATEVNDFPVPQTRSEIDDLKALEDRGTLHTRLGVGLMVVSGAVLTAGIVRAVLQRSSSPSQSERVISVAPIRGGAAITVIWEMP